MSTSANLYDASPLVLKSKNFARFISPITFLLICVVYLLGIRKHSFWGENEAYYALGAASVLKGNGLLPLIYEGMPADKPPLIFWWVALVSLIFGGVSEFAGRFANLLPSLMVLVLVYRFARTYITEAAAVLTVLILATAYEFWENSLEINTDMMLLMFLILTWSAIFRTFISGLTLNRWIMIWVPMGLGLLTKGPVAAVLSGLIAIIFAFGYYGLSEGWKKLLTLRPFTGTIVCLLPFVTWCGLVWHYHGFEPLNIILFRHNLTRFVSAFDHVKPWYYYGKELPVNMLPWSILIPLCIWQLIKLHRKKELEPWHVFSIVTILTVFCFFSFSSSKRDYYLLPLMPWLAMLISDTFLRATVKSSGPLHMRSWGTVGGFVVLIALGIYFITVYPKLDTRRSAVPLALETKVAVDENDTLVLFGEEDPRLIYYIGEKFFFCDDTSEGEKRLDTILGSGEQVDVLLSYNSLKHLKKMADVPLYVESMVKFRQKPYYIMTTEQSKGVLFTDDYIRSVKLDK